MFRYIKKQLLNLSIFMLFLIGIKNLLFAFPFQFLHFHNFSNSFSKFQELTGLNFYITNHVLSFYIGLILIYLSYRLYNRVKMAYRLTIFMLILSSTLQIIRNGPFSYLSVFIDFLLIIIFVSSSSYFSRKSDKITFKWSLGFIFISFFIVLTHSIICLFLLKKHIVGIKNLCGAIYQSFYILFFAQTSNIMYKNQWSHIYIDSLIWINWTCIAISIFLILEPLVVPIKHKSIQWEDLRKLVINFGQNPMSYLSLESDKKFFISDKIEALAAYTIVNGVFVCCADPICDPLNIHIFLNEIEQFCNLNGLDLLFLNTTDAFIEVYKNHGFGVVKYGEDALFKLSDYSLNGGKVSKVRTAINRANKENVQVLEYSPLIKKDSKIEKELLQISEEWMSSKNSPELKFMLGSIGFDNPMDKRYFYALDSKNNICAFVVFIPYLNKNAYLADITRYKNDAPKGVLEKILYESFIKFKSEGVIWANLGLSPLYNVKQEDQQILTNHLFSFIYENLNNTYGFKSLHFAKAKYAPTHWENRYIAFYPKNFSLKFAIAIVESQSSQNLTSIVKSQFSKKSK